MSQLAMHVSRLLHASWYAHVYMVLCMGSAEAHPCMGQGLYRGIAEGNCQASVACKRAACRVHCLPGELTADQAACVVEGGGPPGEKTRNCCSDPPAALQPLSAAAGTAGI